WLPAALPADVEHRIVRRVWTAGDYAVGFEAENSAIAKLNAADEVIPSGNNDLASARYRAGIQGFLECSRVLVCAVSQSTEVADVKGLGAYGHGAASGEPQKGLEKQRIKFHADAPFEHGETKSSRIVNEHRP